MAKYYFTYAVSGFVEVEVEAKDFAEADNKASDRVCEMDFGELQNIEWENFNPDDF